jgi:hypothetical protein
VLRSKKEDQEAKSAAGSALKQTPERIDGALQMGKAKKRK